MYLRGLFRAGKVCDERSIFLPGSISGVGDGFALGAPGIRVVEAIGISEVLGRSRFDPRGRERIVMQASGRNLYRCTGAIWYYSTSC